MLFEEVLVLLSLLCAGGFGVRALAWRRKESKRKTERAFEYAASSLSKNSYLELDNCLALYGDRLPKQLRKHMEARRAELYLADNVD